MRKTTMIFKNIKFTQKKIKQLNKSLNHSLRIKTKFTKKMEWNSEFSDKNLIMIDDEITSLNTYDNKKLIRKIKDKIKKKKDNYEKNNENIGDVSEMKKRRTEIKKLLKKYLQNTDFWGNIDNPGTEIDENYIVSYIENSDLKRKKSKINQIREYCKLHNSLINSKRQKSVKLREDTTQVVEMFFKFPSHNKINEISGDEYLNHFNNFFKTYFKDYEILLNVYHHDEQLRDENIGVHPHIFISGYNEQTQEYDFVKKQIEFVNKYITSNKKDIELLKYPLDFEKSKILGELFQEIFYRYTNTNLLKKHNIKSEILEDTEKRKEQRRILKEESKKPKEKRSFNLFTQSLEELERSKKELDTLKSKKVSCSQDIDDINTQLQQKNELLKEKIERVEYYDKIKENNNELQKENNELKRTLLGIKKVILEVSKKHNILNVFDKYLPFMKLTKSDKNQDLEL